MVVSSGMDVGEKELARIIGSSIRNQSSIQENLSPDEAGAQLSTLNSEQLVLELEFTATKRVPYSDSLVFNHPVQGDLNVYSWNKGYDVAQDEVLLTYNS